jgi:hypothetical protein
MKYHIFSYFTQEHPHHARQGGLSNKQILEEYICLTLQETLPSATPEPLPIAFEQQSIERLHCQQIFE